jgi:hypothetical protein
MSDAQNPNPTPDENNTPPESQTPLEQFLFHQRRALEETGKALESLLPPGFKEHTQAAGNEFANGFRVLVDAAIDEIKKASDSEDFKSYKRTEQEQAATSSEDEDNDDDDTASSGKGKIKVELDD